MPLPIYPFPCVITRLYKSQSPHLGASKQTYQLQSVLSTTFIPPLQFFSFFFSHMELTDVSKQGVRGPGPVLNK